MPKYKPKKSICEPFEFSVDGKKYTIPKLSQAVLNTIIEDENINVSEVFSKLTGAPVKAFMSADLRELTDILNWIMEEVQPKGAAAKNG